MSYLSRWNIIFFFFFAFACFFFMLMYKLCIRLKVICRRLRMNIFRIEKIRSLEDFLFSILSNFCLDLMRLLRSSLLDKGEYFNISRLYLLSKLRRKCMKM